MAIFHFDLKTVSRADGNSTIHEWAYATGTCQVDARTGRVHDWTRKAADILATGKVGPVDWQAAERAERNWNSKVARTLVVALPHELELRMQRRMMRQYAAWLRRYYGLALEWGIHRAPDDARNLHGHFLMTTRRVDRDGVHRAKVRDLDRPQTSGPIIARWRQAWEAVCNQALAKAGSAARVDCRSLVARGITRPARLHMGQQQTAQHRTGYDTPAGRHNDAVDEIERANAELQRMNSRIRYALARRRRERMKRRARIARQRSRWRVNHLGIGPAISGQRKRSTTTPAPQYSSETRRKTSRRR